MPVHRRSSILAAGLVGLALIVASVSPAEAVRRKVIEGTAIGAGIGGVLGLVVGGPRAGLAGAAVGAAAGAIISSNTPDCRWRTNRYGRQYRVCR